MIAKSNGNNFAISSKGKERATNIAITIVGSAITLGRALKKRSKELIPKIKQKIKSNNFTRSNRENANIALAKLKILIFG